MRKSVSADAPSKDEEIFTEAVRIFKQKGYHATSVQDIADAVGLQKGSLYHYISSKEELLLKIFERSTGALTIRLKEILTSDLSPTEKLQSAIEAHLVALTSQLDLYTVYLSERRALTGRIQSQVRTEAERQARFFEQIVQEGIDAGDFRATDSKMVAHAILGMCNWLYQWYSPTGRLKAEEIAQIFSALVIDGLACR